MSELLQMDVETDKDRKDMFAGYAELIEEARAADSYPSSYPVIIRNYAGTFRAEDVLYMQRMGIHLPLPYGELGRLFPGKPPIKKLLGVEVVSINDTNR